MFYKPLFLCLASLFCILVHSFIIPLSSSPSTLHFILFFNIKKEFFHFHFLSPSRRRKDKEDDEEEFFVLCPSLAMLQSQMATMTKLVLVKMSGGLRGAHSDDDLRWIFG